MARTQIFDLRWIKGHSDIEGNEIADQLVRSKIILFPGPAGLGISVVNVRIDASEIWNELQLHVAVCDYRSKSNFYCLSIRPFMSTIE